MHSNPTVLDLFSGIGGFSLGLERAGFETVAFCEIEEYARRVLLKNWPQVPIAQDVRTLRYERESQALLADGKELYRGTINLICGGFPCQDISAAKRNARGLAGERSGLWSEMLRLLIESGAELLAENVALLRSRGLATVLRDLWQIGYDAEWHIIPARAVGAIHLRERLFLYSYPRGQRRQRLSAQPLSRKPAFSWLENVRGIEDLRERSAIHTPMLCRADDGIPYRIHRLQCLGNAVVPQIIEELGRAILSK